MKGLRAILRDPHRSQRGSVLSGVLIITAFLAIISGALATELSTNFLISRNLLTRVNNQATVDSAVEQAMSQLGTTQLNQPCPALSPVTLNSRTAVASYMSCWPTVDVRSPQFAWVGGASSQFNIDATVGPNGDYVVGDAGGNVFDYSFGSSNPRWRLLLGGSITASPLVFAQPGSPGHFLDVLPLSGPACSPSNYCLNVRSDSGFSSAPPLSCSIATSSPVVTQPAASPSVAGLVYYASGSLLGANDVSIGGSGCDPEASITASQTIASGPVALRCASGCGNASDFVYVMVPDGEQSDLVEYSYRSSTSSLQLVSVNVLSWGGPTGMALQGSSLPTNLAISFSGGVVAMFQINSNGSTQLLGSRQLPAGIADAPYWCGSPCGNLLGVGAQNGGLYLFDSSLNLVASYTGTGSAINTRPAADGAGNWYFGADDGYVREVQVRAGQLVQVKRYGPMGQVGSAVEVGACATGICVYLGSLNRNLYLIALDARDAVLSACISTAPPSCSPDKPRLWANIEVGAGGSPQTVHVKGWSYYSP